MAQSQPLENVYKAKLVDASDTRERFVFDVSPEIVETKSIEYKTYNPVHMPTGIHVFAHSQSRTWSITSIKLLSRNETEATINLGRLSLLRGWSMPSFGAGSQTGQDTLSGSISAAEKKFVFRVAGVEKPFNKPRQFGAPPPVLLFSAYSSLGGGTKRRQIHRIPVVITQYSIPYPTDVDYIPTTQQTGRIPMPIIMTLDITLQETHAPNELSQKFDLQKYKQGILDNF